VTDDWLLKLMGWQLVSCISGVPTWLIGNDLDTVYGRNCHCVHYAVDRSSGTDSRSTVGNAWLLCAHW